MYLTYILSSCCAFPLGGIEYTWLRAIQTPRTGLPLRGGVFYVRQRRIIEMSERRIILNHSNYIVLKGLVDSLKRTGKLKLPHFARFAREMKEAIVMESHTIPDDVVTLYSRVRYRFLDSSESKEHVIVFPAQTKDSEEYLSILSPLGLAMIGEREGTIVSYDAPGGMFKFQIEEVLHEQHKFAAPQES